MALFAVPDQFVVPLGPAPPPPSVGFPDTGKRQQKNGEIKFELTLAIIFFISFVPIILGFFVFFVSCFV